MKVPVKTYFCGNVWLRSLPKELRDSPNSPQKAVLVRTTSLKRMAALLATSTHALKHMGAGVREDMRFDGMKDETIYHRPMASNESWVELKQ